MWSLLISCTWRANGVKDCFKSECIIMFWCICSVFSVYTFIYILKYVSFKMSLCTVYMLIVKACHLQGYICIKVKYLLSVYFFVHSLHCTVQYFMRAQFTVYTMFNLYNVQFSQFTVCTMYCLLNLQFAQCTVCTMYSMHNVQFSQC